MFSKKIREHKKWEEENPELAAAGAKRAKEEEERLEAEEIVKSKIRIEKILALQKLHKKQ